MHSPDADRYSFAPAVYRVSCDPLDELLNALGAQFRSEKCGPLVSHSGNKVGQDRLGLRALLSVDDGSLIDHRMMEGPGSPLMPLTGLKMCRECSGELGSDAWSEDDDCSFGWASAGESIEAFVVHLPPFP